MNQQTFIELPLRLGHFVRAGEQEDESDSILPKLLVKKVNVNQEKMRNARGRKSLR